MSITSTRKPPPRGHRRHAAAVDLPMRRGESREVSNPRGAAAPVDGGQIIAFSLPDNNYTGTRSAIPDASTQQRFT